VADAPSFTHHVDVRYLEVDQQGVVFNMWYLAYLDDAVTAFFAHGGLPYAALGDAGFDVQVVHTELDWVDSLRWGDPAAIDCRLARVGTTSFTLAFDVRVGERAVATASTVYVVIDTDGRPAPVPAKLVEALGPVVEDLS
jgi:acyl-CoA thioester hydrolase